MQAFLRLDVETDGWEAPVEWRITATEGQLRWLITIITEELEKCEENTREFTVADVSKPWYPIPAPVRPGGIDIAGRLIAPGDMLIRHQPDGDKERMRVLAVEPKFGVVYFSDDHGYGFYSMELAAEDFPGVGDHTPVLEHHPHEDHI